MFTEGQIDYAFKSLRLTGRPNHLRQTIINLRTNYQWTKELDSPPGWRLERQAMIHVEEKLPAQ